MSPPLKHELDQVIICAIDRSAAEQWAYSLFSHLDSVKEDLLLPPGVSIGLVMAAVQRLLRDQLIEKGPIVLGPNNKPHNPLKITPAGRKTAEHVRRYLAGVKHDMERQLRRCDSTISFCARAKLARHKDEKVEDLAGSAQEPGES